jgi:hypothetical protein
MKTPRPLGRRIALAACLAVPCAPLGAQIPETFENLRHFPKDISRDSLVQVMRGFSFALNVRCQHCHAGGDGVSFAGVNFASDEKLAKQKARYMLQMTDTINHRLLAAVPGGRAPAATVACVTCHRGLTTPATLANILTATIDRAGIDSAIAEYRHLRATAIESGSYDFSEWSINELARHLATAGKTAEAIAILKLNQEFNPQSRSLDMMIGELHRGRGERTEAIARYRAVLARQPAHAMALQRLRELGADR